MIDEAHERDIRIGQSCLRNLPKLQQFDGFGHRMDVIHVDDGWGRLKDFSSVEGLVALL